MRRLNFLAMAYVSVFLCACTSVVEAGIVVSHDSTITPWKSWHRVTGDGNVTLDTGTGLMWLDLTLSTGISYQEVSSELGPGGAFAGYRLATTLEIETFWEDAGIARPTLEFAGPAIRSLLEMWGQAETMRPERDYMPELIYPFAQAFGLPTTPFADDVGGRVPFAFVGTGPPINPPSDPEMLDDWLGEFGPDDRRFNLAFVEDWEITPGFRSDGVGFALVKPANAAVPEPRSVAVWIALSVIAIVARQPLARARARRTRVGG